MTADRQPTSANLAPVVSPAEQRFDQLEAGAFVRADWDDTLFLHFAVDPGLLRRHLPAAMELELFRDAACVSLVALTMRRFRPGRWFSLAALLSGLPAQSFLNFRTYTRWAGEPGAFFLHGWLSRPFGFSLPLAAAGLPADFARFEQQRQALGGCVCQGNASLRYEARIESAAFEVCQPGSLAEFALERYTGFFCRRGRVDLFRVAHPGWSQASAQITLLDRSLIVGRFPWFAEARFLGAHLARGFAGVQIGKPHFILSAISGTSRRHRLSAFYEMP